MHYDWGRMSQIILETLLACLEEKKDRKQNLILV